MNYSHIQKESNLKDLYNMRPIDYMENDNSTILTKSAPRRRTRIFQFKDKSQNIAKSAKVSNKKENKENKENKSRSPQKVKSTENVSENFDLSQICSWNPSFMNNCTIPRQSPSHSLNTTNQKNHQIEPIQPILQQQQIENPQQSNSVHENNSNIHKQLQQKKLQSTQTQPSQLADKDNADLFTPTETYQYLTQEYKKSKLSESSFLSRSQLGSNVKDQQDKKEQVLNFSNNNLFNQFPIHESRIVSQTKQKISQTRTPLESLHESKVSNRVRLSSSSTPSKITTITFTPKITTVSVISNKTILASTPKVITIESNQEISTICPNEIYNNFVDSRVSSSSKPFVYSQIVQNHSIHEIETQYVTRSQVFESNPVSKNEQTEKKTSEKREQVFEPQKSKIFELIEEINLDEQKQEAKLKQETLENRKFKHSENKESNETQNMNQTIQPKQTHTNHTQQNFDQISSQIKGLNLQRNSELCSLLLQFNPKPVRFGFQRTCQGVERETHSIVSQSVDLNDLNDLNISEIKAFNQQFNDMNNEATQFQRRKAYSDSILLLALIGLNTLLENDK